jgi:type IV pilus assembly protein PilF
MRTIGLLVAVVGITVGLAGCETTTMVNGVQVANPSKPPVTEADFKRRAMIRLQLASTYFSQRQFQFAIDESREALKLDPTLAAAHGLLGLIYMELNERPQAEAGFAQALRMQPDNPELLNNYGWFLCITGRERESIAWFERTLTNRLYPTPALPAQNAGICLMKVSDFSGAEGWLRRAFELDASLPSIKFQLARLYLAIGRLDRANFYFSLLERDVEASPQSLWLGLRIARAQGDVMAERKYAEQLRGSFPTSGEAALLRRGRFNE